MAEQNDKIFLITGALITAAAAAALCMFMLSPADNTNEKTASQPDAKPVNISPSARKETEYSDAQSINRIQRFKNYKYTYTFTFNITDKIKDFYFAVPMPEDEREKQYISKTSVHPKPSKITGGNGGLTAVYSYPYMKPGKFNIVFSGEAYVRTYNLKTAKKLHTNLAPEKNLKRYLAPEPGIESNDPYVKKIAASIKGASREEITQNVYKFIQDYMRYKLTSRNLSAKEALTKRYGKCTEYAAVMTALLRAKNIPARIVLGTIAREKDNQHNWVEVYYDEYGWVTYDPAAQAAASKVYNQNGKAVLRNRIYDVSRDDMQYIKAANNLIYPYKFEYSVDETHRGSVSIQRNMAVAPAD